MTFRKTAALKQQQLLKAFQEVVAQARVLPDTQCIGCDRIGSRRTAKAEIDASRKQRLKHLEALRDHQRSVVRQHHAARADTDTRGDRRDLADHDFRRGTSDIGQIVMLGNPVALVTKPVRKAREIKRVTQRRRSRRNRRDGRQIKN